MTSRSPTTSSARYGVRRGADRPAVSIILPTYNRSELLRLSVESIFAQTFNDWELIVADDGSDADTKMYLQGLECSRLRVIHLAHSGNPSRVRNAALEAASGAYVAFLDSDDIWASSKLQIQLAALASFEYCRWSYTAFDRINANGDLLPPHMQVDTVPRSGWIFESLLALETSVPMPTLVAERLLIEEINGFDEEQFFGEFHDLCLRLALRSEVVGVKRVLCSLRAHDQHYSADRMAAHQAWMRLYKKFHSLAPSVQARACCDRELARSAISLARHQCVQYDVATVWRTLREGRALSWRRPDLWFRSIIAILRSFFPRRLKSLLSRQHSGQRTAL